MGVEDAAECVEVDIAVEDAVESDAVVAEVVEVELDGAFAQGSDVTSFGLVVDSRAGALRSDLPSVQAFQSVDFP